jgi:hypothetical protein
MPKKLFLELVTSNFGYSHVFLTLFLPGEGGISPLIVCHMTKLVRNRVKPVKMAGSDFTKLDI